MTGSNLARSSAVMAAGTATSRVLGFIRSVVLATAIGINVPSGNAFTIANTIPNIFFLLLAGGVLNAVLVPQIVRASQRPDGGQEFVDRLLTLALALLLGVTVVVTLAAPLLVRLYAGAFSPEDAALAVAFAYWCLPQLFFYGLYTVLGQVLNARGSFGPYMWAPAVNNVVGIAGLVAFIVVSGPGSAGQHPPGSWDAAQLALVAGSATLGVAVQALVLVIPLRRNGFRFTPRWGWRGVGLRTAGTVASWTFAAVVVGQAGFVVTSRVAAYAAAEAGRAGNLAQTPGNAAYSYAYLLFMLPHSLVAVSVVTALFTRMSQAAAATDLDRIRSDVSTGLRVIGVVSVVATVGLLVLGGPVGTVIADGDPVQGRAVGYVAAAMGLGLVFFSATYLMQRAFYAFEDARTPFLVQLPVVVVMATGNLLSAAVLPTRWIVVGVGVSMSMGHLVGAAAAAVALRRRLGGLDGSRVLQTHVRLLVAGAVAGLVGAVAAQVTSGTVGTDRPGALVTCVVAGVVVLLVYAAGLRTLHVHELDQVTGRLVRRLRRG